MTIFFVHIPKTAGTSFRKAFEQNSHSDGILYDYGTASSETSEIIRSSARSKPINEFTDDLLSHAFICGHVPAIKYTPLVGVRNVMTFVRDPIQRSYSDFKAMRRSHGFAGTLHDFMALDENQNRQTKYLKGIPLRGMGFLGITEFYQDSLELLKSMIPCLNIPQLRLNQNDMRPSQGYNLSDDERQVLQHGNKLDLMLYNKSLQLFKERLSIAQHDNGVFRYHIEKRSARLIKGWVAGSESINIEIIVNGNVVASVNASDFRPNLAGWGIGRQGFVGFRYTSRKHDLSQCELRVANTNQYLVL